jgi:hypothetical protein
MAFSIPGFNFPNLSLLAPPGSNPGNPQSRRPPAPAPSQPGGQRSTPADIRQSTQVVLQARGFDAAVNSFLQQTRGYTEEEARLFVERLTNPSAPDPNAPVSDVGFRDLPPLDSIPAIPLPFSFDSFAPTQGNGTSTDSFTPTQGNETSFDIDRFRNARRRFGPNGG